MTPLIFNLDDEVETTNGTRFKISQIWKKLDGSLVYSDFALLWFSAGDLRLVEEGLKIGDFVEIVGAPYGLSTKHGVGKCAQVRGKTDQGNYKLSDICYIYSRSALRKLTPEEIKQHTATQMPGNFSEIQELRRRIHDLEMGIQGFTNGPEPEYVPGISYVKDPIRKRLSAIEKRQYIQGDRLNTIDLEKDDLRKRLVFVEKIQRDQSDLVGRAIRDGVVEILDFRRKA